VVNVLSSLTLEHRKTLVWAGIKPPETGRKTTCPKCSHKRRKSNEKCLKITATDQGLEWFCYHCDLAEKKGE
jgi:hypothetical protein